MTKVALIIAGQPRSWEKGYEYVKKNLLDRYDVDVFFHTWETTLVDLNKVVKKYNPVEYMVSKPLDASILDAKYPNTPPNIKASSIVSSFYSIFRASRLASEYNYANSVKYDYAVKTRFDYALNARPDFYQVEPDRIYVPNCRMTPERDFCNDQFAFGVFENVAYYCSTYLYLSQWYAQGTIMNGEDMLAANLKRMNLIGDKMVYVNMHNPFPPGQYNGTWHSLIRDDMKIWQ